MEESMSIEKIIYQIKISCNSFVDSLGNQDWGEKIEIKIEKEILREFFNQKKNLKRIISFCS